MDQALRTRLVGEILQHLAAHTTDLTPAEMRQPASAYFDPDYAARERNALFRSVPLLFAHGSELASAGDFVTGELVGTPVLAVRQDDGSVKAFSNVCRHRGACLEGEPRGNRRAFTCPFHAWSYGRDGRLATIRFPEGFCNTDKAERGLIALPAEERHGFVWVVPTPGGEIDVAAHLGPELDAEFTGWKLDEAPCERTANFTGSTNWKLVVDGFLEDYHLPVLHRQTIGAYFTPNLHRFDAYGRHGRLVPVRANIDKVKHLPAAQIDLLSHAIVLYVIFPNAILVWQNDHFEVWTVLPDAKDPARCSMTARLLAPNQESLVRDKPLWDKNWKILLDTVEQEDWHTARGIQAGLAGSGQSDFIFGRNEPALQHFHRMLAATVGG